MNPISASKKLFSIAGELVRHPQELPYALRWLHSMLPGHSPLSDQVPWITFRAIDWLESYLEPRMIIFEYGAGGSTLYFSKRVRNVVSVEHDEGFYEVVKNLIAKHSISNCEIMLREPKQCAKGNFDFTSSQSKYHGLCFESYVRAIESYPDQSFDLVVVDGRARVACVKQAIAKVKPGGAIMLDNSDRPDYAGATRALSTLPLSDLPGIAPCTLEYSQTSVWRVPR